MGAVLVKWKKKQKQKQTPKWGQCSSSKRKGKRKNGQLAPVLGASTRWQKEKRKKNQHPKQGPALIEWKKKENKKKPPNGGSACWAKEIKMKNKQQFGKECNGVPFFVIGRVLEQKGPSGKVRTIWWGSERRWPFLWGHQRWAVLWGPISTLYQL